MSHCTGLSRLLLQGLFVLTVCCSGLVTARADTYPLLTFATVGGLTGGAGGNSIFAEGSGDFETLTSNPNYWFFGSVAYGGPVTDYSLVCQGPDGCLNFNYDEYGFFSGPITITGFVMPNGGGQLTPYQFAGMAQGDFWVQTRGEFVGGWVEAGFSGKWNNGMAANGDVLIWITPDADNGQIAVTTATPEPSTLIMFGSGIIGLAAARRRHL